MQKRKVQALILSQWPPSLMKLRLSGAQLHPAPSWQPIEWWLFNKKKRMIKSPLKILFCTGINHFSFIPQHTYVHIEMLLIAFCPKRKSTFDSTVIRPPVGLWRHQSSCCIKSKASKLMLETVIPKDEKWKYSCRTPKTGVKRSHYKTQI